MWYDNSRILSYNKILNFVIGNRGGGKTYNSKKWCINDYKKNGKHFVWVRRYKTEYKRITHFFDDIKAEFPDDKLEIKGTKAFINGVHFGTFMTLSTSAQEKSTPYPLVNKIIFDEFLVDKGAIRYLKNEVETFLELFETVARMRDNVRALFLGNNISIVNPYFMYFNVKPKLDRRFNKYDDIIIEFYKDEDYINEKNKTRFGKLVSGTSYGDYSIENNFLRDNDVFVKEKSIGSKFIFAFKYNNVVYGVWTDFQQGEMFVSLKYDKCCKMVYSLTKDDHSPNLILLKSMKTNPFFQRLSFAFENGILFFDNMQTKNQFYEFFKYYIG